MADNIIYTVKGQMRWDSISVACYGVAGNAALIINANPTVPIQPFVDGGTQLTVPVIDTTAAQVSEELLPPWKKQV